MLEWWVIMDEVNENVYSRPYPSAPGHCWITIWKVLYWIRILVMWQKIDSRPIYTVQYSSVGQTWQLLRKSRWWSHLQTFDIDMDISPALYSFGLAATIGLNSWGCLLHPLSSARVDFLHRLTSEINLARYFSQRMTGDSLSAILWESIYLCTTEQLLCTQ